MSYSRSNMNPVPNKQGTDNTLAPDPRGSHLSPAASSDTELGIDPSGDPADGLEPGDMEPGTTSA